MDQAERVKIARLIIETCFEVKKGDRILLDGRPVIEDGHLLG